MKVHNMRSTKLSLFVVSVIFALGPVHAQTPPPLKFVSTDGSVLTVNPPTPSNRLQLQGSYQDNTYRPACQKSPIPVTVNITMDPNSGLPNSLNFDAVYCDKATKSLTGKFTQWHPGQQTISFDASYKITNSSTYKASNPFPKPPTHPLVSQ